VIFRFYVGTGPDTIARDFEARYATVAAVLAFHGIDGATIMPAVGVWQGAREQSLVIEIVGDGPIPVHDIADALRATFYQDSVLVVIYAAHHSLVERAHYGKEANDKLENSETGAH